MEWLNIANTARDFARQIEAKSAHIMVQQSHTAAGYLRTGSYKEKTDSLSFVAFRWSVVVRWCHSSPVTTKHLCFLKPKILTGDTIHTIPKRHNGIGGDKTHSWILESEAIHGYLCILYTVHFHFLILIFAIKSSKLNRQALLLHSCLP